ncbi:hypothetical protein PIB30_002050 [Stylosanthes scabra]|uniref:Uncharacterized protein n=1 Tax=Stylosanthes scabra TaxID=79078 RepID=A0ABU6Q3Y9_9FABA|nr:hypothetical protein [Stylosanthes scabra]
MIPSSTSAVKFNIEKFDGRIFFGLWQVQVNDVLIQSGLHKMRKVWPYKEILSWWSKFGKRLRVRTAMEEDELLAGPQLHMGIGWRLMQVV